jgi:hypothetical protein
MISAPAIYKGIPLAKAYSADYVSAIDLSGSIAAVQYHQGE